jgi:nucleoside-diphosphate-sugar epimerase
MGRVSYRCRRTLMSSTLTGMITDNHDFLHGLRHKTIMVAGAGGYLGSALLAALQTIPCRVVALSWSSQSFANASSKEQEVIELKSDLSQPGSWAEPLRSERPDIIFNLAAYEHRRGSIHAPEQDLALNAATMLDLLETCLRLEVKPQIVLASSANLAGCPASVPVNEDFPDQPLNLYSIHKLAAEQYVKYYSRAFGIPGVVLRFANVYGPLTKGKKKIASRVVLNRIMLQALDGGPLQLYRNQQCLRDFVYVGDVVRALCAAGGSLTLNDGSHYLIGSEEALTLGEIVNLIADRVEAIGGRRPEIQLNEQAALDPIEWREFVADCTRMRTRTGWSPRIRLREGIDQTLLRFHGEVAS